MKRAFIARASHGIWRIQYLRTFLPDYAPQKTTFRAQVAIGWGLRPSTHRTRTWAKSRGVPFVALEDGFVRSLGLGASSPTLSLVCDDVGIYYDTTRPSRLEHLILANQENAETWARAQNALEMLLEYNISKYNHAPLFDESTLPEAPIVLVIDQTFGDMAVKYAQADSSHFHAMLQAALSENPHAEIWIKTHPDVLSGKKSAYLGAHTDPRVRLLGEDINPLSLLKRVQKVYCISSQMGFEALLCGKTVITFGVPWYAAWGLTDDRHPAAHVLAQSPRRAKRSVLALFAAAYLRYARYVNPNTGMAGELEDVLHYLRRETHFHRLLAGDVYGVGLSLWKRAVIKPFFDYPACRLHFVSSMARLRSKKLPDGAKILMWGEKYPELAQWANQHKIPLLRMEDGFVRSVGLGSNLVMPLSLVVDDFGIYFHAQNPSRLENILQNQIFNEHDLQAAQTLWQRLIQYDISKYNVGDSDFRLPEESRGRRVILVTGQVEDDASIRFGSPDIRKNVDLLARVRRRNPDAFVIYKPHPDVVSGNRVGRVRAEDVQRWADMEAAHADISGCLKCADEVHTLTSLTGFEALLRGKKVFCYGMPFYAGWGLTEDALVCARRTRRLTLPELICGVLIVYPQYYHPEMHRRIDALSAVDWLIRRKHAIRGNAALHRAWIAKQWGKLIQLMRLMRPLSK